MSKKALIISGLSVLAVIIIIAVVLALGKKTPQQAQNQNPTTGTGTVGQQEGQQAPQQQPAFQIHTDNSQPYAVNAPRSNEPQQQPQQQQANSLGQQQQTQKQLAAAIAAGVLPDANGNYVQKIDNSGVNQFDVSQYNYDLPDNQFLQAYYPDASQVINAQTPTDMALNAQDPVLISSTSGGSSNTAPEAIPLNNAVDPSQLKVSQDNSAEAINNYLQGLSSATAPYDVVDNTGLMSAIAGGTSSANDLKQAGSTVSGIISQLKQEPVPSDMLGLQQSYVAMYENLSSSINDEENMQNDKSASALNSDAQAFQNDINNFTDSYSQVGDDFTIVQNDYGTGQ